MLCFNRRQCESNGGFLALFQFNRDAAKVGRVRTADLGPPKMPRDASNGSFQKAAPQRRTGRTKVAQGRNRLHVVRLRFWLRSRHFLNNFKAVSLTCNCKTKHATTVACLKADFGSKPANSGGLVTSLKPSLKGFEVPKRPCNERASRFGAYYPKQASLEL